MQSDKHYESATDLFGSYRLVPKSGGSERAVLLGWFATKTGIDIGHIAFMVGHLKDNRDLYYLQSDMNQAHARNVPYAASFRTALQTKK